METLGLPITLADLSAHVARRTTPLKLAHQQGEVWNLAPPTQGLVSLAILGITDRLAMADADDAGTVHRIVEATKLAFGLRDAHITDPRELKTDIQSLLDPAALQALADRVDDNHAAPWGTGKGHGDTVWMGVMDNSGFGRVVYPEHLSRVRQRRGAPGYGYRLAEPGASFSLDPAHLLALAPGKQPFHTLNPAAARLNDGRVMVYGSMGGDGQPQTQATLFTRYVVQGLPLQESISRPRWLLGRTRGQSSDTLKVEGRFSPKRSHACRRWVTRWRSSRTLAKPWATRARLSATRTGCLKARSTRAATAAPPDTEEKTMTTQQPDWHAYRRRWRPCWALSWMTPAARLQQQFSRIAAMAAR